MSDIKAEDAAYHILNSLENTNANFWTDPSSGHTWHVDGNGDIITIDIVDEDWEEISSTSYRLVKIDE